MKEIPKLVNDHSHIPYSTKALNVDTRNETSFVPIPGMDERCKWCILRQEKSSDDDDLSRVRAVVRFPKGSMERKSGTYYFVFLKKFITLIINFFKKTK